MPRNIPDEVRQNDIRITIHGYRHKNQLVTAIVSKVSCIADEPEFIKVEFRKPWTSLDAEIVMSEESAEDLCRQILRKLNYRTFNVVE